MTHLDEYSHLLLMKSEILKNEIEFLESMSTSGPTSGLYVLYLNTIGVIEYNRGMVSDSLKYFEKVLKINSTNTSAIICISFIYRQKGRVDAADRQINSIEKSRDTNDEKTSVKLQEAFIIYNDINLYNKNDEIGNLNFEEIDMLGSISFKSEH